MTQSALRKKRTVAAMMFFAFVLLIALLLFPLAWLRGRQAMESTEPAVDRESPAVQREFPADVSSLQEFAKNPSGIAGMKRIAQDPADIAPPDSAVRNLALQRKSRYGTEEMALYHDSQPVEEIVQHYREVLADKGFAVRESVVRDGVTLLAARRGKLQVVLRLHKHPQKRKIVNIALLVVTVQTQAKTE